MIMIEKLGTYPLTGLPYLSPGVLVSM